MKTTDDDVSLEEFLTLLRTVFDIEGDLDLMPLDRKKQLLHLVVATEDGIMLLRLKRD